MADIKARAILQDKMTDKLKGIENQAKKTNQSIGEGAKGAEKSMSGLTSSVGALKAGLVGLAGVGLGALAKGMLSANSEMENLTTKFGVLLGDVDSAKARMQELSKFAQTTPFQLEEVANASRVLQTLGGTALATGDSLRLVGDASAISGESFENLAIHVGRAYSGLQSNRPIGESLARLQELGLVSGETRNKIEDLTKSAQGKEAWLVLQKELQKSNGGMAKLSQTMTGLTSTLKDQLQTALRQMGKGLFDNAKEGLNGMVSAMNEMIDGGLFQRIGAGFAMISNAGRMAFNFLQLAFDGAIIALNQTINSYLKGVENMLSALPSVLVPDSWLESVRSARISIETNIASMSVEAQEDANDMSQAFEGFKNSFNNMVNGVKVEEFKEKTREATQSVVEEAKKSTEDLKELRNAQFEYEKEQQEKRLELMRDDQAEYEKYQKEQTRIAQQEADHRRKIKEAELGLAMTLTSSLSTISQNALGKSRKNAGIRKGIALSEAIINTGLAYTKALASSPPPINFINGASVLAMGGAQISTIASQKFAMGGIVKPEGGKSDIGDKTLIRVNAGEGVFTKDQMKALGERQSISVSPVININGNADSGVVSALQDSVQMIADKVTEAIRSGKLDLNNELGLA